MLTAREIAEWLAYFTVKEEHREQAEKTARLEARASEIASRMSQGRGL